MFTRIIAHMLCVVIGTLGRSLVVNGDKMILIPLKSTECVPVLQKVYNFAQYIPS